MKAFSCYVETLKLHKVGGRQLHFLPLFLLNNNVGTSTHHAAQQGVAPDRRRRSERGFFADVCTKIIVHRVRIGRQVNLGRSLAFVPLLLLRITLCYTANNDRKRGMIWQ